MSLASKILLGLTLVVTLVFFYFAARTLQIHVNWRSAIKQAEARIAQLEREIETLEFGTQPGEGVRDLRVKLHEVLVGRGRVWSGVTPQAADAEAHTLQVALETPSPHRIEPDTVLYLFEEAPIEIDASGSNRGGSYLGEFRAAEVAEGQVRLAPTMDMTEEDWQRVAALRGPWMMYEVMPVDSPEVFVGVDEEQLRTMLPPKSLDEEFLSRKADDPDTWNLRDYSVLFHEYNRRRVLLEDLIKAAQTHQQDAEAALADARRQIQFREQERSDLGEQLRRAQHERDLVDTHLQAVQQRLDETKSAIARLFNQNRRLAAEIAAAQIAAGQP